jgi:hypothetical protein
MAQRGGVRDLAKLNERFAKHHTSGEDLDRAIQRAVAFVGQMPKEDRVPPSDHSRPSTSILTTSS